MSSSDHSDDDKSPRPSTRPVLPPADPPSRVVTHDLHDDPSDRDDLSDSQSAVEVPLSPHDTPNEPSVSAGRGLERITALVNAIDNDEPASPAPQALDSKSRDLDSDAPPNLSSPLSPQTFKTFQSSEYPETRAASTRPTSISSTSSKSSLHSEDIDLDDTHDTTMVPISSPPPTPSIPPTTNNLSSHPLALSPTSTPLPPSSPSTGKLVASPTTPFTPNVPFQVPKGVPISIPESSSRGDHRASVAPSIASTLVSEPESVASASTSASMAKKVRPESIIIDPKVPKLVLGLAVVDFNHIVGPTVEMAYPPSLLEDEEMCKILPFLALPDGAHLNKEDYSYFHIVPSKQTVFPGQPTPPAPPHTIFGISCNRQIATSSLLSKEADVTRSTVQKAVVVLASKPLFGLIRDKLGVVTRAFFNQRDFRDTEILKGFCDTLEASLRAQLTESGIYMGTSLRELVHKFRHRTLILLKLMMLQKKIMFFGHPVERLCTYQYSLISLIPGLLLALEDSGVPELASRAEKLEQVTEFKSSDRKSLLKFMGLPLEIFGKNAFFQPYLPLQQVDMMKTDSFICGTTNSILTHQRDARVDLLINIELNTFEFNDPVIERLVTLTPADRRWMDDIVNDVNEGWNENDPQRPATMQFKGSDDYLRIKFEDYICSALSAVKYADFLKKSAQGNVTVSGASGDPYVLQNFGEAWLHTFRQSPAFQLWDGITDPVIFDIVEPRHPCETKPSAIADIGLRLTEGIHELKIGENLAPTREAITSVISTGSSSLFKAFDGMRSEVTSRLAAQRSASISSGTSTGTPSTASTSDAPPPVSSPPAVSGGRNPFERRTSAPALAPPQPLGGALRPLSLGVGLSRLDHFPSPAPTSTPAPPPAPTASLAETAQAARAALSGWGASLWGKPKATTPPAPPPKSNSIPTPLPLPSTASARKNVPREDELSPTFVIRDLDKEREEKERLEREAEAASRRMSGSGTRSALGLS